MAVLCAACAAIGLGATGLQKLAERKIDGYWMVPQTDGDRGVAANVPDVTRIRMHGGQVDIHQSARMTSMADDVTLLLDGKPHPWKSQVSVFGFPSDVRSYEARPVASGFLVTEHHQATFPTPPQQSTSTTSWTITGNGKQLVIADGENTVTYERVTFMRELFFDRF